MSYFASAVCLIILFDECMLILLVMLQGPHQIINSHAVGSVSQDLALFRPVRGDNVDGPVLIPPDIRFLFYIAVCSEYRQWQKNPTILPSSLLSMCPCHQTQQSFLYCYGLRNPEEGRSAFSGWIPDHLCQIHPAPRISHYIHQPDRDLS